MSSDKKNNVHMQDYARDMYAGAAILNITELLIFSNIMK